MTTSGLVFLALGPLILLICASFGSLVGLSFLPSTYRLQRIEKDGKKSNRHNAQVGRKSRSTSKALTVSEDIGRNVHNHSIITALKFSETGRASLLKLKAVDRTPGKRSEAALNS